MDTSASLAIACIAYLVGTASPGPSNIAIMGVAMQSGRTAALATAAGVVCGSLIWGLLAAFGLSGALAIWSGALGVVKIVGGLYLLWLAFKAARAAWSPKAGVDARPAQVATKTNVPLRHLFLRGAAMHLTNPKAIFVWLSIVSMALPPGAGVAGSLQVVGVCACIGVLVFGGYALLFSTATARKVYARLQRGFEFAFAAMFGYAGVRLLLSKDSSI